jgi:hypothetical protein
LICFQSVWVLAELQGHHEWTALAIFIIYGWFYHFKFAASKVMQDAKEMHITAASVGTHKGQKVFTAAVNDVVQQVAIRLEEGCSIGHKRDVITRKRKRL